MVIFLVSELNPSDLTTSLMRTAQRKNLPVKVFYICKKNEKLIHPGLKTVTLDGCFNAANIKMQFVTALKLIKLFVLHRPASIYCSGRIATIFGILLARICLIPNRVFTRHHGVEIQTSPSVLPKFLEYLVNRSATKIVAISSLSTKILISEGVDPTKIYQVYNGIDLERALAIRKLRESTTIRGEKFPVIGVVSRLTQWKGVQFTASAFTKILELFPNARLEIYGSKMDSYDEVLTLLSKLPSNSYEFYEPDDDVFTKFQRFDIFVHVPIEEDTEAFGLVYLEALATGVPSIFTCSGILREFDPGSAAVKVPFKDSQGIESTVVRLMARDLEEFIPMQVSKLEQFDLKKTTEKYLTLLFQQE